MKKGVAAPFSNITKLCLSTFIMISLNVNCVKSVKQTLEKYSNTINYGILECPICHSHKMIGWGHYNRNVIYKDKKIIIEEVEINRVRCKSCKHTHALLPTGLIPYKQISNELLIEILEQSEEKSNEKVAFEYNFGIETIKRWSNQFKKYFFKKLETTFLNTNKKSLLKMMIDISNQIKFFTRNNKIFMQIKYVPIIMCSS